MADPQKDAPRDGSSMSEEVKQLWSSLDAEDDREFSKVLKDGSFVLSVYPFTDELDATTGGDAFAQCDTVFQDAKALAGSFALQTHRDVQAAAAAGGGGAGGGVGGAAVLPTRIAESYAAMQAGDHLLSLLLVCAEIDRCCQCLFVRHSGLPRSAMPSKVTDRILSLHSTSGGGGGGGILPAPLIRSLLALCGPIHGINARNLAFHGFLRNVDVRPCLCSLLIACLCTMMAEGNMGGDLVEVEHQVPTAIDPSGLHAPNIDAMRRSHLVSSVREFETAFRLFSAGRNRSALLVLLPLMEHGIRRAFASFGGQTIVLASLTELSGTMDLFLEPVDNKLIENIPDDLYTALLDAFFWRSGGRMRDHVAHGTVTKVSSDQARFYFSLATSMYFYFAVGGSPSPPPRGLYTPSYHPLSVCARLLPLCQAKLELLPSSDERYNQMLTKVSRLYFVGVVCLTDLTDAAMTRGTAISNCVQRIFDSLESVDAYQQYLQNRINSFTHQKKIDKEKKKLAKLQEQKREFRGALSVLLRVVMHMAGGREMMAGFEVSLANQLGAVERETRSNRLHRAVAILDNIVLGGDGEQHVLAGTLSRKEVAANAGLVGAAMVIQDLKQIVLHGRPMILWSTGLVLERHFTCCSDPDLAGKTVVELGSGSGFLAIALALRGAHVVATEMPGAEFDFLQRSVAAFQPYVTRNGGSVTARTLLWGQQGWEDATGFEGVHFDYVVGADLVYDDSTWEVLMFTMDKLMRDETTTMYLGFGLREDWAMEFFAQLHDCDLYDVEGQDIDTSELLEDTDLIFSKITKKPLLTNHQ